MGLPPAEWQAAKSMSESIKWWARRITSYLVLIVLLIGASPTPLAHAAISSCSGFFAQTMLEPSSQSSINLQVNNSDGSDPIAWIKVSRPTATSTTVIGGSTQDGIFSNDADSIVFSGINIVANNAYDKLFINVQTGPDDSPPAAWTVQASSDPSGADPVYCDDLGLAVGVSNGTPPLLSGISVDTVNPESATVSWSSDEPATTQLEYGLTSRYGSSPPIDTSLTTAHSVTLTGLTPNTGYHFQVKGSDGQGNAAASSDNTFLTAVLPPPSGTRMASDFVVTRAPVKAVPTEFVPPTILLTTALAKTYKMAPLMSGMAADNEAVADIAYSLDGGKNWIPADTVSGLGGKKADFSFTPTALEDGNYTVLVRAVDTSGNVKTTDPITLVIDRLNPSVGGFVISEGPQIMRPDGTQAIAVLRGMQVKINLSAVGGPTHVMLSARLVSPSGRRTLLHSFSLTKSADSGLWSGIMSYSEAGEYVAMVDAIDGGGNTISQLVARIRVVEPAKVVDQTTRVYLESTVTIYYFEPVSQKWVIWDGSAYGQANPQNTDQKGAYAFLLPPGKFYAKATATKHYARYSSIFKLSASSLVTTTFALQMTRSLGVGGVSLTLPDWAFSHVQEVSPVAQSASDDSIVSVHSTLLNKLAPDFVLSRTDGSVVHSADLLGKPTLLTFASSWLPTVDEQLGPLAKLQPGKDINIVPIASQENAARITAYTFLSRHDVQWLVDSDGSLSTHYCPCALPTHYFIDRNGYVRRIASGILTQQEITDTLGSL